MNQNQKDQKDFLERVQKWLTNWSKSPKAYERDWSLNRGDTLVDETSTDETLDEESDLAVI